jgi:uncharacterized membrane protein YraQ (UPF0718 family)
VTAIGLRRAQPPVGLVAGAGVTAWLIAWFIETPFADWLTYDLLGLARDSQLGGAVAFFAEDVPKVLLLLTGVVTLVSFLRSFISPERVRAALAGRGALAGTAAAAGFGVITPFCSCSAVPLFIGFLEAGVPLGVTFAFLVSSPMVNEVALVLLWGLFGPVVAIAYMASGLAVAIVAGLVIGRLGLERWVEGYVWQLRASGPGFADAPQGIADRLTDAWRATVDILRRVAPFVIVGIAIGAVIHGYVPTELVASLGGRGNPLAVPALVALGVPLYSNAAGTIPVVEALLDKGLPLGSALAFMMAVTALSIPEWVILRRVMKPQLLVSFIAVVAVGILAVGYGFNLVIG